LVQDGLEDAMDLTVCTAQNKESFAFGGDQEPVFGTTTLKEVFSKSNPDCMTSPNARFPGWWTRPQKIWWTIRSPLGLAMELMEQNKNKDNINLLLTQPLKVAKF